MALTPITLIAVDSISSGAGLTISPAMVSNIDKVNSNALINAIIKLAPIVANSSSVSTTYQKLPSFLIKANTTANATMIQAKSMFPAVGTVMGTKNFLQLLNGASGFISMGAGIAKTTADLNGKSFSDMGVGIKSFGDLASGGVTAIFPKLKSGTPEMNATLKSVGTSLKNFGIAFDFKNLNTVGTPSALVETLQKQGLADKYNINSKITTAGYDPKALKAVPDTVLVQILSSVTGDDVTKIANVLSVKTVTPLSSLADMLNLSKFIEAKSISAMGLDNKPNAMTEFASSLSNLGTQADNTKLGDMMASIETTPLASLDSAKDLLPAATVSSLSSMTGKGSGPHGNPILVDIMGTVAGYVHVDTFKNIASAAEKLSTTAPGKKLVADLATLITAVDAATAEAQTLELVGPALSAYVDSLITTPLAAVDADIVALNTLISTTADLKSLVANTDLSISNTTAQLSTEITNINLAGITIWANGNPQNLGTSTTEFLALGGQLHDFGVDKTEIGYSTILEGVIVPGAGDAVKAALLEGRNLAATSAAGKRS